MITPRAVRNGVYLQSLSKKQTLAVMLGELARHCSESTQNSDFEKAFELTSLMLEHYPNNQQYSERDSDECRLFNS